MAEKKQIIILFFISLLIGIFGLIIISQASSIIEEDVIIDNYEATFYINGTLNEEFTYDVKTSNKYRMLYRFWDAPLSTKPLAQPSIEFSDATFSADAIFYLKDYQGNTLVNHSDPKGNIVYRIDSLAYKNEVGYYNPDRYQTGKYTIKYIFNIHPPIEYDANICHLNLKLADEHITYRNVKVTIKDKDYVLRIFQRPLSLEEFEQDNEIIFTGEVAKNELLEIEMLLKKEAMDKINGFPQKFDDVSGPTIRESYFYSIQYYVALALRGSARVLALCSPLIIILLYLAYGKEKDFAVPKFLSFVPNEKIKPWVVNLVFKRDALDFDENGFYATLLDLHKRNKIQIKKKDKGLSIRIINAKGLDDYEKRVFNFLKEMSEGDTLYTSKIKSLGKKLSSSNKYRSELLQLKREVSYLTKQADNSIASNFMINGRMKLVPFILISASLFVISLVLLFTLSNVASILSNATKTSLIPIIQFAIALAFPSTLFGKWKGSAYKEKLQWDSFKRFLSDLALIRKYAPDDLSMWGSWLVYGTSLGLGDNVVKIMKELKIPLKEIEFTPYMPLFVRPIMTAYPPSAQARGSSGGFGGGGFGAGGGFGGGGGGAR